MSGVLEEDDAVQGKPPPSLSLLRLCSPLRGEQAQGDCERKGEIDEHLSTDSQTEQNAGGGTILIPTLNLQTLEQHLPRDLRNATEASKVKGVNSYSGQNKTLKGANGLKNFAPTFSL